MPIELERLKKITHIVTHDNCADGRASALILLDVLPDAKVTFVQYETELQKTIPAEPGMIFCDFSPHISRFKEFLDVEAIVLDHHGGPPEAVTKAFEEKGLGAFASEKEHKGVSGALLAFREVWVPMNSEIELIRLSSEKAKVAIRDLATLTGVRDTWQRQSSDWELACQQAEALKFWPWEILSRRGNIYNPDIFDIGPVLYGRNQNHVKSCVEASHIFKTSKGRRVHVFEGLKPSSDAAEMLGDKSDLIIGFGFNVEQGKCSMIFSTRSHSDFHCRNFAMAHGGGGHVRAAGFSVVLNEDDPHPYQLAEKILEKYELVEDAWTKITSEDGFDERVKNGEFVPKVLYQALVPTAE